MYKCLNCGNTEKFYGIAKEQGNALIFQNCGKFESSDGSMLKEALHTLIKNHDRQKQPVIGATACPNVLSIDRGPCQVNNPYTACGVSGKNDLSGAAASDPGMAIRGDLWAIQNDDREQDVSWAYIISDRSWKGFHQVQSCAACSSTNIAAV